MYRRLFSIFIVIFSVVALLSGCWNYREIESLAIVSGVAIDKNSNNQFLLTAEILDLQGSQSEGKVEPIRLEAEGDTIFDAARNMIKVSAKKLYWSHAKAVIVSQDVAKEGITPIIDFIARDNETRLTMTIFVSKEKTAKELLNHQSITTEIRSFEMEYMMKSNDHLSKSTRVDVVKLIDILSDKGIYPYLPAMGIISNDGKKTANLSGIAIFKKDQLIGFLDEEDTKFFLFTNNTIKGGLLIVTPNQEKSQSKVTLEIFKNRTNVTPVYLNETLTMKIDIHTEVSIREMDTGKNYMSEENLNVLTEEAEAYLKENIENTIQSVQENFNSDIFGFGRIVQKDMPLLWKSIVNEWDEIFQTLDVEVNVAVNIKDGGLISRPIQVGD